MNISARLRQAEEKVASKSPTGVRRVFRIITTAAKEDDVSTEAELRRMGWGERPDDLAIIRRIVPSMSGAAP